jgi:hypothetical protein
MKWYKFIKVILIISMSLNLFSGMVSVVSVFLFNSALSAYNLFSAVVSIGMGIMALFAWLGLRNYRSYGPKLLVTLYSVNLGISAFSVFAAITNSLAFGSGMAGVATVVGSIIYLIPSIAINLTMIICNSVYFKKRKHLFK